MANTWFRMYSEFATDPKVQMLSEVDQRRLTMLFCLRCNGHVTLHDDEVTFLLRISNDSWMVTKELFIAKGFINSDNEVLNWDKRQFISDSSSERVARHRAKKKDDVTQCNVTVTPPDTEQIQNRTDTDINTGDQKSGLSEKSAPSDSKIDICPHKEIIALYAKHLPAGIQPKVWNETRQSALRARWREDEKRQNLAWWDKFFYYISKSDFLTGKINAKDKRAFEISLDWICNASNFVKIIEGRYENKEDA